MLAQRRCSNGASAACIHCGLEVCNQHLPFTYRGSSCRICDTDAEPNLRHPVEPYGRSDGDTMDDGYDDSDYNYFESDDDEAFVDLS